MSGMDWAGIITALTALLVVIGHGVRWLVTTLTAQGSATIAAKDKELAAKDAYIDALERLAERREE